MCIFGLKNKKKTFFTDKKPFWHLIIQVFYLNTTNCNSMKTGMRHETTIRLIHAWLIFNCANSTRRQPSIPSVSQSQEIWFRVLRAPEVCILCCTLWYLVISMLLHCGIHPIVFAFLIWRLSSAFREWSNQRTKQRVIEAAGLGPDTRINQNVTCTYNDAEIERTLLFGTDWNNENDDWLKCWWVG